MKKEYRAMNPTIIDTTLRDGEQAPGVAFSIDEKLEIATMLDKLGIDEVEAGTPAIGAEEQEAIRQIAGSGFTFITSCWCRANIDDIRTAASLGTGSINISLPVSDVQIEALGKSRKWILSELKKVIAFAGSFFPNITMGAQDASRAEPSFLKEYIFHALDTGAQRIRISDTVGLLEPRETSVLITALLHDFPNACFEFHGHNDLGLATANSLEALQSGAGCISATINGLGERAGNASLEQILAILKYKQGIHRFKTEHLAELCALVANRSHRSGSQNMPVVGKIAFTHESGIHTAALIKNKKTYQFLDPSDFGLGAMQFIFGKHSGTASLKWFFENKGIELAPEHLILLITLVKRKVSLLRRNLTESELVKLYNDSGVFCQTHLNVDSTGGVTHY